MMTPIVFLPGNPRPLLYDAAFLNMLSQQGQLCRDRIMSVVLRSNKMIDPS